MDERKFIKKCKEIVRNYYNDRVESTDKNGKITTEDVFVVWFCKTLQNSKALLSTNVSDGMYYEVTYNGDKNECYLDAYKKWQNVCIEMQEQDMREIKFRAWDKDLKRWTNYSIDDDLLMFYDKHAECWETDQEGERFILCQYTGLKKF